MTVLAYPFRIFFLLTGIYGSVVALLWVGMLFWGWPTPAALPPMYWHAREILFGLAGAAIAGFLLTAMCNWTGAAPLRGTPLLMLALLWMAGRVAAWWPNLDGWLYALADLAFLTALTVYVTHIIIGAGNRRNLILVFILAMLLLASTITHPEVLALAAGGMDWQGATSAMSIAIQMAIQVIVLLMVIIAGRITPAFTANWLERHGKDRSLVTQHPWIDRLSIASVALLVVLPWLNLPALSAIVALIAAALNAMRLAGWGTRHCLREPLLWVLHLGYGWIVVALLLKGLAPWVSAVTDTLWIHAAGVGAMGTLILGVMTRVALGHTGRPFILPSGAVAIYVLITLAALSRLLPALGWTAYQPSLAISASLFSLAFALFTVLYWSILTQPRVDGRPG